MLKLLWSSICVQISVECHRTEYSQKKPTVFGRKSCWLSLRPIRIIQRCSILPLCIVFLSSFDQPAEHIFSAFVFIFKEIYLVQFINLAKGKLRVYPRLAF
jgi:hypothetical protein